MADAQIALPARVGGIGLGEASRDREGVAVGRQRPGQITLGRQDVADPVVADAQIALPARVGGIGLGEASRDREGVAVGRQRPGQITLGRQDVADLVVADAQIALPACVRGIGLGQAPPDREGLPVGRQRPGQITLGRQDVADLVVADGTLPEPLWLLCVRCREARQPVCDRADRGLGQVKLTQNRQAIVHLVEKVVSQWDPEPMALVGAQKRGGMLQQSPFRGGEPGGKCRVQSLGQPETQAFAQSRI